MVRCLAWNVGSTDTLDSIAMNIVLLFVSLGFMGGLVTAMTFSNGIRISLLDVSVAVFLIVSAWQTRKQRYIPKMWIPIVTFAAVAIVSGGDLAYIIRWLLYAALYWVTVDMKVLVFSGVGIAFLGYVQYFLYPDLRNLYYLGWDPHYQRLFSTLLDPNFTGIILGLTSLLLLTRRNLFWFGVTFIALVLTYSRSSYVAFLVGLIVWGVQSRRKALVACVVSVLIVMVAVLPKTGEGRNLLRTVSSFARIDSANYAISRIQEKPLLGHGFRPHAGIDTSLLFVAESTGIIGLVVYAWLLMGLWKTKEMRPYLAAILVHSLFVNSLFYPWVMVWMWIMAGISRDAQPSFRSRPDPER